MKIDEAYSIIDKACAALWIETNIINVPVRYEILKELVNAHKPSKEHAVASYKDILKGHKNAMALFEFSDFVGKQSNVLRKAVQENISISTKNFHESVKFLTARGFIFTLGSDDNRILKSIHLTAAGFIVFQKAKEQIKDSKQ